MNGEILINAIGGISDSHITEFAVVVAKRKTYNLRAMKWLPAACFGAFIILTAVFYRNSLRNVPEPASSSSSVNSIVQTDFFDPSTYISQILSTESTSNPNSTVSEHTTTGDCSVLTPPPVSQVTVPNAVYQNKSVSYSVAKQQFDHPVKECTAQNFKGYEIGIVSQTGKIDGSEKITYLDMTYNFSNGIIIITDQDRMFAEGSLYMESLEKIKYKGHTFMVDLYTDNDHVCYEYYPTKDKGLAYKALFDKDTDKYEILDLILSLEVY